MKCQYHPTQDALNYCNSCDVHVCVDCSNEAPANIQSDAQYHCFVCNNALDGASQQSQIAPFWSRLMDIYKYPLNPQGLGAIFLLASLSTLFKNWWLFSIIPAICIYLYSFACLRKTAQGENDPPDIMASFEGSILPVIYIFIAMLWATLLALFFFSKLGAGFGIIASFVLAAVMPASFITIAIEEKLLPALNFGNLFSIIKHTGTGYWVMVLFVMIMMSSMGILTNLFADTHFHGLSVFLSATIGNYYSIVVFHILGYLVYQNHENLGYSVTGKAGIKENQSRSTDKREKAKLELLIKAGQFEAARKVAKNSISKTSNIWEWDRTFKLLCIARPSKDLPNFFKRYAMKLNTAGEHDKFADAYLQVKKVNPNIEIEDEKLGIDLAEALLELGKPKQAITVARPLTTASENSNILKRAFGVLSEAFSQIPGGEKHARHYASLANQFG